MSKWILVILCSLGLSVHAQLISTNLAPGLTNLGPGLTNPLITAAPAQPRPLSWDSELKEYNAKQGELTANFVFNVTNTSAKEVIITGTQSSCGCTVAKLPSVPWPLAPGATGQIQVTVNLANKVGTLVKQILVMLAGAPPQTISIKVVIPAPLIMSDKQRQANAELARADAQSIFKGSCADCHLVPAQHRVGGELYMMLCGVCHESPRRASMVPNLHALTKPTDFNYWKNVIANGKTNSLMPAFSIENGGPLSEAQVNSLADFLNKSISRNFSSPPDLTKLPASAKAGTNPHPFLKIPVVPEPPTRISTPRPPVGQPAPPTPPVPTAVQ